MRRTLIMIKKSQLHVGMRRRRFRRRSLLLHILLVHSYQNIQSRDLGGAVFALDIYNAIASIAKSFSMVSIKKAESLDCLLDIQSNL